MMFASCTQQQQQHQQQHRLGSKYSITRHLESYSSVTDFSPRNTTVQQTTSDAIEREHGSDDVEHPIPKTRPKRKSTLMLLIPRRTTVSSSLTGEEAFYLDLLRNAIKAPKLRQSLINLNLGEQGDTCLRIRFCAAVCEFTNTNDKREKTAKAQKIIATFIQKGSRFQLEGLPSEYHQRLWVWTFLHQDLNKLKEHFELEMIQAESMRCYLRELFPSQEF